MIKIIALLFLVYFFFRSVGYVLRILLGQGNSTSPEHNRTKTYRQKPKGSNLNVERPNQQQKRGDHQFNDGEYIDYEEVD